MFQSPVEENNRRYRAAMVGLAILSTVALATTIWMMIDFVREQSIVDELTKSLPREVRGNAELLSGELRWQFRLAILVVLNVIVTGIAVILLWRAYHASQASLRDVKALATDILGSMETAVITTDLDGIVTSINKCGCDLLDYDPQRIGRSLKEVDRLPLESFRSEWIANRSPVSIREFQIKQAGNRKILLASCQSLKDREGSVMGNLLQIRDITMRTLMEEQMRRMERYTGLGSLVGGLHHEIRNPLAALSLHVQLLEEQLQIDGTSEQSRSMLSIIRTELARIGGVLEAFRDFASISHLDLSDVNLRDLIARQVELVRPQAQSHGVSIVLGPCDPQWSITADRGRLEQVLLNLFVNSIDAMPQGGTLRVSVSRDEASTQIEVTDTGCGIPENLQDKILDPYFTTKGAGTGLGLAICDKIMRQHQGTIDFRSSPQGTTFRLTLPSIRQP
ncbi:MAG: PAS domain S-box protein [Planctomycetes bacterium]|nr:PAS domain S-box protein [Planctomycetota bacterium]